MANMFQIQRKLKAGQRRLDALAPKVGDLAPDFCLHDLEGENPVSLSIYCGQKPVALVFGSHT